MSNDFSAYCGKKRGWPEFFYMSVGPCELCGKVCECNSVKSKALERLRTWRQSESLKKEK